MNARDRLAARQAALVRALLTDAPLPPGFDPHRIHVEATALRNKRRRVAERLRPDLADALDDRFPALFNQWAAANPHRAGVSVHTDLAAFATWLTDHGHLP